MASADTAAADSRWHVIDADGQVLGRIATVAARLLQGKHKPTYTPFIDTGDHVVVVNAAKVKLTGRKEDQKIYRQHSGYEGGLREERARLVRAAQAGAARRRSRARHAAQDEDGRGDVSQAEGVRRSGSSARGAETLQARGRVTWQQLQYYGTGRRKTSTARVFLRPGSGAITVNHRDVRSVLPHRSAAHADPARRSCSPKPPTSSTCSRRSPAAACRARPARCGSASRARSSSTTLELRKRAQERRAADARRARQGTQEVRHGGSAQALPVQQTVGRRHRRQTEWRQFGRDRDEGSAGGRRSLRPPDEALEPEDEGVHLRRAQRHLHHRPGQDGEAVPRRRGVRQPTSRPKGGRSSSSAPSGRRRTSIAEEAQRCGMFFVNERWLGGLLTNFATIQRSLGRLRDLEAMATDGRYDTLSKKEIARNEKETQQARRRTSKASATCRGCPTRSSSSTPSKEQIAVDEARKLKIPVIGIVDTNCDPDEVDFVIPGNDDALRAIRLFASRIADAVLAGRGMKRVGRRRSRARRGRRRRTGGDDARPRGRRGRPGAPREAGAGLGVSTTQWLSSSRQSRLCRRLVSPDAQPYFRCMSRSWHDYRSRREEAPRPDRRGHDGVQGGARPRRTATSTRRTRSCASAGSPARRRRPAARPAKA